MPSSGQNSTVTGVERMAIELVRILRRGSVSVKLLIEVAGLVGNSVC